MNGGVYFAVNENNGLCKIGFSKDVASRIAYHGKNIRLVHIIQTLEPRRLEGFFHTIFYHHRVKGEWFNLSSQELEFIKSISRCDTCEELPDNLLVRYDSHKHLPNRRLGFSTSFRIVRIRPCHAAAKEHAEERAQNLSQYVNEAVRMRLEAEGRWPPRKPSA